MTNDKPIPGLNGQVTSKLIRPDRCECCKFAEPVAAPSPVPQFECRRHPPTVTSLVVPSAGGQIGIANNTTFPITQGISWCGEFTKKVGPS